MGVSGGSVERVKAALAASGHADTVRTFPEGTRSAAEAAAAVGCEVAQIAKSIVFRGAVRSAQGDARSRQSAGHEHARVVLVIASGANRVDTGKVAEATGLTIRRAEGNWVRDMTGFAIGGVAPVGHLTVPVVLVDQDLFAFDRIWAAAGSPMHVFATTPEALLGLSGGRKADVKEGA